MFEMMVDTRSLESLLTQAWYENWLEERGYSLETAANRDKWKELESTLLTYLIDD